MPRSKQVKAQALSTTAPTVDYDAYDEAVIEARKIIADAERGQLRLGALAAKVETIYGEQTLAKFADAIGIAPCTLERYRSVYKAWAGKTAPGLESVSYAVRRELATHPHRERIIQENPNITKREAHRLMREQAVQEARDSWFNDNRRWFKDLCTSATELSREARIARDCSPEKLNYLLEVIEPSMLPKLQGSGRLLVEVAEFLQNKLDEQDAAEPEPAEAA
jgi:hypothetical protein